MSSSTPRTIVKPKKRQSSTGSNKKQKYSQDEEAILVESDGDDEEADDYDSDAYLDDHGKLNLSQESGASRRSSRQHRPTTKKISYEDKESEE